MKTFKLLTIIYLAFFALSCSKSRSGKVEHEREISISELPQIIKDNIADRYIGAELLEADEITQSNKSITYDVEIKHESLVTEVMYKADGTFIGVEAVDQDDEGDDDEDGDDEDEEEED